VATEPQGALVIDLKKLYWDGIAPAGRWSGIGDFHRHLHVDCYQAKGHVVAKGDGKWLSNGEAAREPVTSYHSKDVLRAPGFFALAASFLPVAQKYLGTEPKLYSVNAFWTRPTDKPPNPDIQVWHRDRDDDKFLVLFMYGTSVVRHREGPHNFVLGSHRNNDHSHRAPLDTEEMTTVFGPAGTMFLADTSGLHYGQVPRDGERMLTWARYGVSSPPAAYEWDKTQPVPASSLDLGVVSDDVKRMTRLVVDWEA
jgi:hypothetical protein